MIGAFAIVGVLGDQAVDGGLGIAAYGAGVGAGQAFFAEAIGTFILAFVVFGAIDRRAPGGFAGLAIGLAVFAIIVPIAPATGASINPGAHSARCWSARCWSAGASEPGAGAGCCRLRAPQAASIRRDTAAGVTRSRATPLPDRARRRQAVDIALARAWVQAIATAVDEQKDYLTQLDSAIGDADHGINLQRGFSAVMTALDGYDATSVGGVLVKTGTTLVSTVGGAAGPLYGTAFRSAGKVLTEPTATPAQLLEALTAGLEGVQKLGRAVPGDKTIVDAFAPAVEAFAKEVRDSGDLATAAQAAALAADEGMHATTPLQAKKGRASYLGPRSVGHQDPGATSTALIFRALAEVA